MTLPKVGIAIPYYRVWEGPMGLSSMATAARSASQFTKVSLVEAIREAEKSGPLSTEDIIKIVGGERHVAADTAGMLPVATSGCYVESNRNALVNYFLDSGIPFTHILWIDTDMQFPEDALLRLLAHDKDIVGANYRTRTPPYSCAGIYERGDSVTMTPGLHRMVQIPTGVLLCKFDVFKKLPFPWFKESHSKTEARDDVYFCHLARAKGYEIWCDNDLTKEIVHIDVQQIPWFSPDQIKQVEVKGAQLNLERSDAEGREQARETGKLYEKVTGIAAE